MPKKNLKPQDISTWLSYCQRRNAAKPKEAYQAYSNSLLEYGFRQLLQYFSGVEKPGELIEAWHQLKRETPTLDNWINVGGQLIRETRLEQLKKNILRGIVKSWSEVHNFYLEEAKQYPSLKCLNGLAVLAFLSGQEPNTWTEADICGWLQNGIASLDAARDRLLCSRRKDVDNPFRKMIYENELEMSAVVGCIETDPFIIAKLEAWNAEQQKARQLIKSFELIS